MHTATSTSPTLQTPEEIHICELLHLLDVGCFGNLLVIEENPRCGLLTRQLFAHESNVMTSAWLTFFQSATALSTG